VEEVEISHLSWIDIASVISYETLDIQILKHVAYHICPLNYPTTHPSPNPFHHSSKSGFHNKIH
jgi:hypothetical protein